MVTEIEVDNVSNQYELVYDNTISYNGFSLVDTKLTYANFFNEYLLNNKPCKILDVCQNWEATKLWVQDGKPNFSYLHNKYGPSKVTLYNCNEKYFNSQKTEQCEFTDYLKYWEQNIIIKNRSEQRLLYLKDWHLKNQFPDDRFYEVPIYFASDWLNEYLCEKSLDDYRFVYMGVKGTWTPFHVDVFTSYSWSINVCGQKKWLFFAPGTENKLRDDLGNLPYDITNETHWKKGTEIIQNVGEAVFVPSGWHHQVWNLADTISINHNWINGCNIKTVWHSLVNNLNDVKKEIDDCKDMEDYLDHCQVMLKASFGMDFVDFYEFIQYIALKRIDLIEKGKLIQLVDDRTLGKNHALFDIKAIQIILELLLEHKDLYQLKGFKKITVPPCTLLKIVMLLLQRQLTY